MAWIALFVVVGVVGVLGVVVNINRLAFDRRLAAEMAALVAMPPLPLQGSQGSDSRSAPVVAWPAPVARYQAIAVGAHDPIRTARLEHGGTFSMKAGATARPIKGTQLFTADPPGFVWFGRIRLLPGLWVDARDMTIDGKGSMRVLLDDTVPLVDVSGPELDQGSALRLLAEMPWFPTALFDARIVTWSAIDATHARATLTMGGEEVSGVFEFGDDGLPATMTAQRFADSGELRPWGGHYRDWRTVDGLVVPFEAEVFWELEAGPFTYAHWRVESVAYDAERAPRR